MLSKNEGCQLLYLANRGISIADCTASWNKEHYFHTTKCSSVITIFTELELATFAENSEN